MRVKRVVSIFLLALIFVATFIAAVPVRGEGEITSNVSVGTEVKQFDLAKDVVYLNTANISVNKYTDSDYLEIYADSDSAITSFAPRVRIEGVEMRPSTIKFQLYFYSDHNYSGYNAAFKFGSSVTGDGLFYLQSTSVTDPVRWALMYRDNGIKSTKYVDFARGYVYNITIEIYSNYTCSLYINDSAVLQYFNYNVLSLRQYSTYFDIVIPATGLDTTHKYHVKISNFRQIFSRHLIDAVYREKFIAMTMDDATIGEYNYSKILINNSFTATISVNAERVGGTYSGYVYMTWDEIKELYGAGFELANHGHNHSRLTDLTINDAKLEIYRGKLWLEENVTGLNVVTFVPPTGATNWTLINYTAKLGMYDEYLTLRETLTDTTSEYTPYVTYNEFYNLIKYSEHGYCVLYHHAERDISEENFTALVELAKNESWMIGTFALYKEIAASTWDASFDNITFTDSKYTFTARTNGKRAWVSVYDFFDLKDQGTIIVKDLTTGKEIEWREGSIEFLVEDGHTYEIVAIANGFAWLMFYLEGFTMTQWLVVGVVAVAIIAFVVFYKPPKRYGRRR